MVNNTSRLIGGILLVSGTTIGAAMLALPVASGFAGFWPSIAFFCFYWMFMTFTAFLMLEVNLWVGEHTNLITMAKKTLGKTGQYISCGIYLFLLYSLTTAYIAGGGPIFAEILETATQWTLPKWIVPFPLLIIFGFFVYRGTHSVDYINRFLMIGLVIAYILMITLLTPHVEQHLLDYKNWKAIIMSVSIVSTSFGFHIIIPTLTDYLHRDVKKIRSVILIGSLIPLIVYISWEFLALGIIPLEGKGGLAEGYQAGQDGATLLSNVLQNKELGFLTRIFSLLAILTSFLGVSLSLRDFLSDGLKIKNKGKEGVYLYLLTFLPPLFISLIDPRAFLNALEYAGAFGVVTLLGVLPVMMVWRGRYHQYRIGPYRAPGGKFCLGLAMVISLSVIGLEIYHKIIQ